jgi:hypothetical protein
VEYDSTAVESYSTANEKPDCTKQVNHFWEIEWPKDLSTSQKRNSICQREIMQKAFQCQQHSHHGSKTGCER